MENNRKIHGYCGVHGLEDGAGAHHSRILFGTDDVNGIDYRGGTTVIAVQYANFTVP